MNEIYQQKQYQLQLQKEELQYYKRKYKQKLEQFNQQKRSYRNKLQQLAIRITPEHTQQSFNNSCSDSQTCEDLLQTPQVIPRREASFYAQLQQEQQGLLNDKQILDNLKKQLEDEKSKLKRDKYKNSVMRIIKKSHGSSEFLKVGPTMTKSQSEERVEQKQIAEEWQQIEVLRATLNRKQKELEESVQSLNREREMLEREKQEFLNRREL